MVLKELRDITSQNFHIQLPSEIMLKIENIDVFKVRAVSTRLLAATSQFSLMMKNLLEIEKELMAQNIKKANKVRET